ncbi:hypothetical protein BJY01DRAFT_218517, partial [Aspergillus pseudoustus]
MANFRPWLARLRRKSKLWTLHSRQPLSQVVCRSFQNGMLELKGLCLFFFVGNLLVAKSVALIGRLWSTFKEQS